MDKEQKNQEPDNSEAAEDDANVATEQKPKKIKVGNESRWHRFLNWYKNNKKKSMPLTILLLLIVAGLVPWSRYALVGLVVKNDFSVVVMDSTASTPVSGAAVRIGSINALTDSSGKATLHQVKAGTRTLVVGKKYYQISQAKVLVPIFKQKNTPNIRLVATGRQVKILVTDLVNHKVLKDVDIKVADIEAKTDETGSATIVLPAGTTSAKATLKLKDYNDSEANIKVSDQKIEENKLNLTPAGKVYFLSKLSGKIDVVKTNLDGTSRQTVLAGTGKEEDGGTVLLASRDWKYLALLSHREGTATKLFLINTSDDSMVSMDGDANVTINPIGWNDHHFIYSLYREKVLDWQPNKQAIKSYNAENNKITLLDQTKGEGTSQYDYARESYGSIYQIGNNVIYEKIWYSSYYSYKVQDKQAGIYSIATNGGNPTTLKSIGYESGKNTYINSVPYKANEIYYQIQEKDVEGTFEYSNGKITAKSDIKDEFDKYYQQGASTYLQSPSGDNTFWSESRDGKNTLLIGDNNGENGKQIATLSDYQTYGWFTDDYLLVSKKGSELYIMPKDPAKDFTPIKITDYHKPARSFNGYGGGYGGL